MARILTPDLLLAVIELAKPSAMAIIEMPGTTWGPKYVMGSLKFPGIDHPSGFMFGEEPTAWRPQWGDELPMDDFRKFAEHKRQLAERGQGPTSQIVVDKPWLLERGDNLYAGGTWYDGISVGVAGINSEADELIAKLVLTMLIGVARMEARNRVNTKNMVI